jgi:hypothetical protein
MKNIFKLIGIIALAAVIWFSMAACGGGGDDEDDPNNPNGPNGPGSGTGGGVWTAVTTTIFDDQVIEYNGIKYTLKFDIKAIAFGSGKFVAGGESGKMAYSSDGKTWTAVSNSTFGTNDINAIAFGGGKFVAGGENGKMATSTDGVTWTAVSDSKFGSDDINAIAFGNNTFVAGGSYIAYSSDNGASWVRATGIYSINAIAYGNNMFIAGGGGALNAGMRYSTNNGVTWTSVSDSKIGTVDAIAFGNNTFVAGAWFGGMATSSNGATWTAVDCKLDKDSSIDAIAFGNNTFVAGCYDDMSYSTDNGATWTPKRDIVSFSIYAIAFGNGTFVAVGRNGGIAYSTGIGSGGGTNPGTGGTAPTITTTALTGGTVGTPYSQILTATGDTPITWTISSGTLPTGLSLVPTTGVISGTPTTAGAFNFTVKATNTKESATKALTITIAASGGGGGGSSVATLTLSGQVYTQELSYSDMSYSYKPYTGNITNLINNAGGTGSITGGKLSFSVGTPPASSLEPLKVTPNNENIRTGIYADARISPSGAKYVELDFSNIDLGKENFNLNFNTGAMTMDFVYYVYVDTDCTATATGGTYTEGGVKMTFPNVNLQYKRGWNTLNMKLVTSSSSGTISIGTGDLSSCRWVIDLD